jgi:hypothetical protein
MAIIVSQLMLHLKVRASTLPVSSAIALREAAANCRAQKTS